MNAVIIGAGGLGREVYWVLCDLNQRKETWKVLGFIDLEPELHGKIICDIPVLGDFKWFETVANKKDLKAICASGSPITRHAFVQEVEKAGCGFLSLIHPSVQHSKFVEIGTGSVIAAGCILTTQIKIGNHSYVNIDTTIGHDTNIDDYVNISPGCHISGRVTIKEGADIGTGAVVIPKVTIGKWATVGAGAVVIDDVPDNAVVVGTPAEVIKYKNTLLGDE
jgi:sugar O-acyltransferase (sialic acid O-acetyltransferase NeuD family)